MIFKFFKKLFGFSKKKKVLVTSSVGKGTDYDITKSMKEHQIDILARTLWGEARGQSIKGMYAVAAVILNRVAVAKNNERYWWGHTITDVCLKAYQFSCWNKDDPSYKKLTKVTSENRQFRDALKVATEAVEGTLKDPTHGATHYHADYISAYWAEGEKPTVTIKNHIFYKLV